MTPRKTHPQHSFPARALLLGTVTLLALPALLFAEDLRFDRGVEDPVAGGARPFSAAVPEMQEPDSQRDAVPGR